jgi:hypothetical protein
MCYVVDAFFSSILSARGYTCWNLFSYKRTGLDIIYLMRRRAQSPSTLTRLVSKYGAPTTIKSDNAPEFKSKRWVSSLKRCVYVLSSPRRITLTKALPNVAVALSKPLPSTYYGLLVGCPLEFWCYALEHVCLLRTILARHSLDWSTPHELNWGERPDISMFFFIFWEPIWYLNPRQAFPKTKMLKGRLLGIGQNVGDAFCFLILTQPESDSDSSPQVLARSVIRL